LPTDCRQTPLCNDNNNSSVIIFPKKKNGNASGGNIDRHFHTGQFSACNNDTQDATVK